MAQDAGVVSNKKIISRDSHLILMFSIEHWTLFPLTLQKANTLGLTPRRYDAARVITVLY
jgi:hypothetical protein